MKYTVETRQSSMFAAIVTDAGKASVRNIYYQGTKETAMWICAAMNHYEREIPMQKFIDSELAIKAARP